MKNARSRHKRHLRLLESLRGMCWRVEVCYVQYSQLGVVGTTDTITGRHLFWALGDSEHLKAPTAAPPFRGIGDRLTFVLVGTPGVHREPVVVRGWKKLAKFTRDRFEEGK